MRKLALAAFIAVVVFGCSYREVEYKEKYCSKVVSTKHYDERLFGILPGSYDTYALYIVLEDGREIFVGYNKKGLPLSFDSEVEKRIEDGKYCEYYVYHKKK